MKDMGSRNTKFKGAGFVLVMLLLAGSGAAQEASEVEDVDDIGPSVNTSDPALTEDAEVGEEREELQPAVPAAVLATDVTRQESGGRVMDRIELVRTEITGNSELPTVLYIVPWQKSDPGDMMGKPVNTLLDEVLAPIDREEFIRQVDYYDDMYGEVERK
jgi:hypothetical protein